MGKVIVAGQPVECRASVTTWQERPELGFKRLKMRAETRAVVWHWTGGTGGADQVHRTLVARGLSCHFLIEPGGRIVQFADTATHAMHAGQANPWSIGVEMVNPATPYNRGADYRDLVRETIHGVETRATTFTAKQFVAALALAETLEDAYELPATVPMLNGGVYAEVVPEPVMARFSGHVAHYMLNAQKRDCGLALMRCLAARPLRGQNGAAE